MAVCRQDMLCKDYIPTSLKSFCELHACYEITGKSTFKQKRCRDGVILVYDVYCWDTAIPTPTLYMWFLWFLARPSQHPSTYVVCLFFLAQQYTEKYIVLASFQQTISDHNSHCYLSGRSVGRGLTITFEVEG